MKTLLALTLFFSSMLAAPIMATASKTGMYFAMSKQCTNGLNLINTKGSLENIQLLKSQSVSVALAQKDALKLMKSLDVIKNFTDHSFSFKGDNKIYYYFDLEGMKEFVHLIIRKSDKNSITFNDLDGYRIAHGHLGSGSYITANNIKDILWADFDYKLRSIEYNSTIDALYQLDNNSIDIIVSVIRKRPEFIQNKNSVVEKLLKKFTILGVDRPIGDIYDYGMLKYDWVEEEKAALSVNPVIIFNSDHMTQEQFNQHVDLECYNQ
jgi:hypothetical protein